MNWKYIFNPFLKLSEISLLIVGFISIVLGSFIGNYFSVTFDGIIDAHVAPTSFVTSLKENLINVILVFIVLSILGKVINSKTRLIDILNISMVYRIPLYLSALLIDMPILKSVGDKVAANIDSPQNIKFEALELVAILAISSVLILLVIYSIVLLVKGFKTATNLKKWQHYVLVAIALIAAEVFSKIIINNL